MRLDLTYLISGARRRLRLAAMSAFGGSLSCERYVEMYGFETTDVLPFVEVERPLPLNMNSSNELPTRRDDWGMSFAEAHRRRVRASSLHTIEDIDVVLNRDRFSNEFYYLFGANGTLIEKSGGPFALRAAVRSRFGRAKQNIDEGAWILGTWYPNYFHWMILHLVQIAALQRGGWSRPIIGPPGRYQDTRYIRDSISLMGVPRDQIVEAPSEHFRIGKAVIVDVDFMDARLLDDVRRRFWSGRDLHPHRRIYVKRPENGLRRVINSHEIELVMEKYGFETLDASGLTLSQQVDVFSEASAIVGLHGAGLSNMLFAAPGALIFELSDLSFFPNPFYYALAGELGHQYIHVPCKAVQEAGRRPIYSDVVCDPALLRERLESWL